MASHQQIKFEKAGTTTPSASSAPAPTTTTTTITTTTTTTTTTTAAGGNVAAGGQVPPAGLPQMPTSGFGAHMLDRNGWHPGRGLGRYHQGITEPIELPNLAPGAGLGFQAPAPASTPSAPTPAPAFRPEPTVLTWRSFTGLELGRLEGLLIYGLDRQQLEYLAEHNLSREEVAEWEREMEGEKEMEKVIEKREREMQEREREMER